MGLTANCYWKCCKCYPFTIRNARSEVKIHDACRVGIPCKVRTDFLIRHLFNFYRYFTSLRYDLTPLSESTVWICQYKSQLIILRRANICLGEILIPGGLFFLILLLICANYVVLATRVAFYLKAVLGFGSITLGIWFILVVGLAGSYPKRSAKLVELKRRSEIAAWSLDGALARELNCCTPFKVNIGPFVSFSSLSVVIVGRIVTDNTITAIISF